MTKPADKFEAARTVVETVKDFDLTEQEMVFRWAAESLGLPTPFEPNPQSSRPVATTPTTSPDQKSAPASNGNSQDIKSFVAAKNPRSDVQFVATVAYYYQFVAPAAEKKASITTKDLLEALRKVGGRKIPPHPEMTLNNAYSAGLLDRAEKGVYAINSVGENLVTMTLPGESAPPIGKRRTQRPITTGKGSSRRPSTKAKA